MGTAADGNKSPPTSNSVAEFFGNLVPPKVEVRMGASFATTPETSKNLHTECDCILIAILLCYAQHKLDSVAHCFTAQNCRTLAGKPKLFFIQTCQGDRLDSGFTLEKTKTEGESSMSYIIPVQADFLIAYSTIPGKNITNNSFQ